VARSDLPVRARVESWLIVPLATLVVASGTVAVERVGGGAEATGWLAVAGLVAVGVVGFLFHHRTGASAANTQPMASLGVANWITVVRGLAYACAAGFVVFVPAGSVAASAPFSSVLRVETFDRSTVLLWGPAVLYGGGAILDSVDGAVARRVGKTTSLGEKLDLGYDTLGFVVAPAVGVAWGRLPAVYLALSGARYVYRLGITVEQSRGRTISPLPSSALRRPLAAGQMAFLSLALVPAIPASLTRVVAPFVLAPSLIVFLRDYLAVTGRLPTWLLDRPDVSRTDGTSSDERAVESTAPETRPKTHNGDD
jgi:CDP-diacylglycerol--glycerol-3-phosphate 3-phosphatidyltransferase